jgi:hypothetical protein
MKVVFKAALKVHRFQKFVSRFLPLLEDMTKFNTDNSTTLEDILPPEVAEGFSECIHTLPRIQVLPLMKALLFHFQNDYLNKIENEDLPMGEL